jgi:hypothetical protein
MPADRSSAGSLHPGSQNFVYCVLLLTLSLLRLIPDQEVNEQELLNGAGSRGRITRSGIASQGIASPCLLAAAHQDGRRRWSVTTECEN